MTLVFKGMHSNFVKRHEFVWNKFGWWRSSEVPETTRAFASF